MIVLTLRSLPNAKNSMLSRPHKDVVVSGILFAIALTAVISLSFNQRHFQLDDALIYLRYIKNFQAGHGLVYNPGDKFNGLTSPLFTYAVLLSSFVIPDTLLAATIISCLFMAIASILAGQVFSESKWEAAFTSIAIGSFAYFYSTFGLETPLFLMLIAASLYLYKINSKYFVVALGLLVTTRAEGLFLAMPMLGDYVARQKKLPDLKLVAVSSLIVLLPLLANYFYYGAALPATAGAKIAQGQSGYWGEGWIFLQVHNVMKSTFSDSKIAALLFLSASAYGAFLSRKDRVAAVAVVFLIFLGLFYVGLNIPNYHWYYAPFFLLMIVFACKGVWYFSSMLLSERTVASRAVAICVIVAAVFAFSKVVSLKEGGRHEAYAQIGSWLKENTSSDASVALVEIGTVGWYSDRKIIDILGLVNGYNAEYVGKRDLYSWLTHYRPDYILRHEPRWPLEQSTKALEEARAYEPAGGFDFPGYVLLKKSDRYSDQQISELALRSR